ncbi:NIPSNAP family protein [Rhizobium leguminosarum]|uniref:NIPSNAP family protein n=1 Tax=Rhizobium leguminosarum TaxID=384 RepID=UPI001C96A41A|nr:NIPSNAP family protein [Rhizobium leguminosarum]MBY5337294.1 NIPSNAP family protein [Rhizobium leguminosarum]MBY5351817.1 NIPSNAP family protein [Rhizobium leguminosarum]
MIYELRIYDCLPGRLPALLNRFAEHTLTIWDKHGIKQAGFFTTIVGESSQRLTYLIAWESLADREVKWKAFTTDPAWLKARDESERDGQIISNISSQLLSPTAFSAVK